MTSSLDDRAIVVAICSSHYHTAIATVYNGHAQNGVWLQSVIDWERAHEVLVLSVELLASNRFCDSFNHSLQA